MAQAKGVPFGPIFSPAELLETEQYVTRGFLAEMKHPALGRLLMPQLPVQWNGRSFAPRPAPRSLERDRSSRHERVPLTGVRVLDFGLLTAGANTSAMLADLGADVIKIESGAYLDPFRVVGKPDNDDGWWNRSPQFRFTNRNKRGLALNLKDPEGQRVIRELAKHCDVVVENFRRGVLDRAGLGYADAEGDQSAHRVRRHLQPGRHRAGAHERVVWLTLDATSGIASLTGYEGEEPRISGMDVNYPDQIVSLFATGIVITAVMEARRSGKGAFLDFSQREVASFTLGEEILAASADPVAAARARAATAKKAWRSRMPIAARMDAGSPSRSMRPIRDSARSAPPRTARTPWRRCSPAGIAAAPCNDGADLLRDTSLAGVTLVRDEHGGLVKGLPYRLDGKGITIERAAPDLGQHTDEVLRELLGYGDADLAKLEAIGRDLDDADRGRGLNGARRSAQD